MKEFDPMKIAVVSFITLILAFMFLFAVLGDFSETAYTDTVRTAQAFVGQPASAVISNYGTPVGRQFVTEANEKDCRDAYWYYDNIVFRIYYDGSIGSEGIVADAEGIR